MEILPLTLEDREAWANLLAISFGHSLSEMGEMLDNLCTNYSLVAWGAWDGSKLAAQYSCLVSPLLVPDVESPESVGMSINMAVDPDYRGQGLVKRVAAPVYEALISQGAIAGVGFSNAAGVRVDKQSKGYGYRVVGQMKPVLALLLRRPAADPLQLSETWPTKTKAFSYSPNNDAIRFAATSKSIEHRFGRHSFRAYHFGVWESAQQIEGIVVYRAFKWKWIKGVALLAAYSDDLEQLIARWGRTIWDNGVRFVRLLTTPTSQLLTALRKIGFAISLPYSRTPYYLTVKSLTENTPAILFDFSRWDCTGGDIR
ncbi:MAG: GNAT family N-acetyltransferase [Ardenticatenaceae bacterium]